MNKTIYINLGGILFQMEEDAHNRLHFYLKHLEQKLGANAEAAEVTADIEQRIAELLKTICKSSSDVVTLNHINEILETIGEPDAIASDGNASVGESATQSVTTGPVVISRKFYRNASDRILGGVCSGLAAYANVDVTLMRLIWLLGLIFTVGTLVFWAYIILWIVVPTAANMNERMAMHGGFSFGEKLGNSNTGRLGMSDSQPMGANLMKAMRNIGLAVQRVAGFFITAICILLLFISVVALMAGYTVLGVELPNGIPVHDLIALIIPSGVSGWSLFAVGAMVVIPILGLLYLGIRMMVTFRAHLAVVWTIGAILWFVAFTFSLKKGSELALGFAVNSERTESISLQTPSSSVIHITALMPDSIPQHEEVSDMSNDEYAFMLNKSKQELLLMGKPQIRIEEGDVLSLKRITRAKGANLADANKNRQRINHQMVQQDTTLICSPYFQLGQNPLFRKQRVEIVLTVPKGIRVEVSPEMRPLLIEN